MAVWIVTHNVLLEPVSVEMDTMRRMVHAVRSSTLLKLLQSQIAILQLTSKIIKVGVKSHKTDHTHVKLIMCEVHLINVADPLNWPIFQ